MLPLLTSHQTGSLNQRCFESIQSKLPRAHKAETDLQMRYVLFHKRLFFWGEFSLFAILANETSSFL